MKDSGSTGCTIKAGHTGWSEAAVMNNPIHDFVTGNIPGARNACSRDVRTRTSVAVIVRKMVRAQLRKLPLQVADLDELLNSKELRREQDEDSTLVNVQQHLAEGNQAEEQR